MMREINLTGNKMNKLECPICSATGLQGCGTNKVCCPNGHKSDKDQVLAKLSKVEKAKVIVKEESKRGRHDDSSISHMILLEKDLADKGIVCPICQSKLIFARCKCISDCNKFHCRCQDKSFTTEQVKQMLSVNN